MTHPPWEGWAEEESRRAALDRLGTSEADLDALLAALGDPSWRVRREAVERLARFPEPDRVARRLLAPLGESWDVGWRNAAVTALAALGGPALPALLDGLALRPPHRKLLIDALGRLGDRRAVPSLAAALDDPDANVRAAAAEALGELGGEEAVAALAAALAGRELLLTVACLGSLHRLEARLPLSLLVPLLDQPVLRPAVLANLGDGDDPAALPFLVDGLDAPTRLCREAAADALLQLRRRLAGDGAASRAVAEALRDLPTATIHRLREALLEGAPASRRAAAALLGGTGQAAAVRNLVLTLGDPELEESGSEAICQLGEAALPELLAVLDSLDEATRTALYHLLPRLPGTVGNRDFEARLVAALGSPSPRVRAAAAQALGELGGETAPPPLVALLGGDHELDEALAGALSSLGRRHRAAVRGALLDGAAERRGAPAWCRILGAVGEPGDADLLGAWLSAPSPAVRRAAIAALAELPTGAATAAARLGEALARGLVDEEADVRLAAARAVAGRGLLSTAPALARSLTDEDAQVRLAAAQGLAAIGGPLAHDALRRLAPHPDPALATVAVEALGRWGEPDDVPLLLVALRREEVELQKAALTALGRRGAGDGLVALAEGLRHPRWDVRLTAVQAFAAHPLDPTGRHLLAARLAEESDDLVRGALERALAVDRASRD